MRIIDRTFQITFWQMPTSEQTHSRVCWADKALGLS
jgi:hypothetical protein